jgi:single stranded DNA-binding protein
MANPTITLTGRIGQEPTVLSNGGLKLRVVTNDRGKNEETGMWEDKLTSWWTVKVWNKLAEASKDVLNKGQEVTITGTIYEENWKDQSGNQRNSYDIRAETIAVTTRSLSKSKPEPVGTWSMTGDVPF